MTQPAAGDARIAEWKATGHPYKAIAAAIAEWALKQPPGTLVPGNDHFDGNLDLAASDGTWTRARTLLATTGVIRPNGSHHVVA